MGSEWKPIESHRGLYEVSRCGQVRKTDGSIIGQWPNSLGYLIVRLSRPRIQARVHRLVAGAFLPNPNQLPVVNHLDSDRSNNKADNLEWCTQADNLRHASDLGRMQRNYWCGRRSPSATLSDDDVKLIREWHARTGQSWSKVAERFGVSKRTVGRILKGQSYV